MGSLFAPPRRLAARTSLLVAISRRAIIRRRSQSYQPTFHDASRYSEKFYPRECRAVRSKDVRWRGVARRPRCASASDSERDELLLLPRAGVRVVRCTPSHFPRLPASATSAISRIVSDNDAMLHEFLKR